ncbi:hypothetical protein [Halegenticoccus soli]|uniref:hypothetical protein n=1 Tax=Halegenticoccus soli TaxID=1985678 RepID=UPI000C6CD0C7|nr:hypothetical protein [Halegenticoccus soli]
MSDEYDQVTGVYGDGSGASPYKTTAVYSVTVGVAYESVDLTYATEMEVVPRRTRGIGIGGGGGGGGDAPPSASIESLSASSCNPPACPGPPGSKHQVTADWTADDPEGRLRNATVRLYDADTASLLDEKVVDLSSAGGSAAVETTFGNLDDGNYEVEVVARDKAGGASDPATGGIAV